MMENINEAHLQTMLKRFFRSNPVYTAENLYVFGWESDMLIKTRSGMWYEVECKISKADFIKDFAKTAKHLCLRTGQYWMLRYISTTTDPLRADEWKDMGYVVTKDGNRWHAYSKNCMQHSHPYPNHFSYCVPWYMEEDVTPLLPPYAGLVVMREDGILDEVKKPPVLHKEKYTDEQLNLCEKFYFKWRSEKSIKESLLKEMNNLKQIK